MCQEMEELVLDPQIRAWVILPIMLITFLVGMGRHYAQILITDAKKPDPVQTFEAYDVITIIIESLNH